MSGRLACVNVGMVRRAAARPCVSVARCHPAIAAARRLLGGGDLSVSWMLQRAHRPPRNRSPHVIVAGTCPGEAFANDGADGQQCAPNAPLPRSVFRAAPGDQNPNNRRIVTTHADPRTAGELIQGSLGDWVKDCVDRDPIPGMSETLAEGLVSRFITVWRDREMSSVQRAITPQTMKRAAAYRATRDWVVRSVPRELFIFNAEFGASSGLDKRAMFLIAHWQPSSTRACLDAMVTRVFARDGQVDFLPILIVTRHALVRLFQRLRTADPDRLMHELNTAALSCMTLALSGRSVLSGHDFLVPTPSGAAIVNIDPTLAAVMALKTWLSDARMRDSPGRLKMVERARREKGLVVIVDDGFVLLSQAQARGDEPIPQRELVRMRTTGHPEPLWAGA